MTQAGSGPRYRRTLPSGLVIASTRPEHGEALEALQELVFPTLVDEQRFKAPHYRHHVAMFGEGQFVALDGGRVVGATSTIRLHFDFGRPAHTFADLIRSGWMTSHQPEGEWLYGMDVSIHPEYRRRGLATALYAARQELVWRLGLRGQLTAGMMSGYGTLKDRMPAEEYFEGLKAGRITDPTLSMQQSVGFEVRALLPDYLTDPVCDNYSVLIVLDAAKDVAGAERPVTHAGERVKE
jgi:GNAT superfamily N-acetyltransferase